jgi:hypothetical protein
MSPRQLQGGIGRNTSTAFHASGPDASRAAGAKGLVLVPGLEVAMLRITTIAVVVLIAWIYHGGGIHFLVWPDSLGYLDQALSIASPQGYQRAAGRSVGYPLFLLAPLSVKSSALAIFALQTLLVLVAYRLLYLHVVSATTTLAPTQHTPRNALIALLPLLLAITASYSALQVFMLSLLPEILFVTLAFGAVLAVSRFAVGEPGQPHIWLRAAGAAAAATLPILVKPHWMFAAPVLVLIVAAKLAALTWRSHASRLGSTARLGAALVLPLTIYGAVGLPERYLSANFNPEAALFGPRVLFCNHVHMIRDAWSRAPQLTAHSDPAIDTAIKEGVGELLARDANPWKVLGVNGDLCFYDPHFQGLVGRLLPAVDAQRAFYLNAYTAAVWADPVRFALSFLRQMVLGLEIPFHRFAFHVSFPNAPSAEPSFLWGTTQAGDAGPLASKATMKTTLPGLAVLALLAIIFNALLVIYLALFALSVLLAPWLWCTWPAGRQRAFLAYVSVPIAAILSHNALVAVAHSFDIWRYAFNLFFVNLGFMTTAALFWLEEVGSRRRGARAAATGG